MRRVSGGLLSTPGLDDQEGAPPRRLARTRFHLRRSRACPPRETLAMDDQQKRTAAVLLVDEGETDGRTDRLSYGQLPLVRRATRSGDRRRCPSLVERPLHRSEECLPDIFVG
jgi:hypothetical protein